jgi:hypothetical protein
MSMPSASTVAAVIVSRLDGISLDQSEASAKLAAITAIVEEIRTMVLAAAVTGTATGVTAGGASAPVTGVLT